ncbi:MAG: dockerin type I repeat-containing protein [Phycisphaerales bacterium]|nr:dockerin type I repeat-containing protein [Phycisphaerales bacterium]
MFTKAPLIPLLLAAGTALAQNSVVIPNGYENAPGPSAFIGPLHGDPRTNQFIIRESQLTAIVGQDITAIAFRLPASATSDWPIVEVTYFSYDILLSDGVNPSSRQFDFFANVVGPQDLVRTGPLVVTPFSFTTGGAPNDFGPEIELNEPWHYAGGNLVVEVLHTGHDQGFRNNDAVGTSEPGYLTEFANIWQGTGPSPVQGNFSIIKLITDGATCPPDLNGDGVVDADDFFLFLQLFADGDPRADFNNDGVIDADDFFAFLNAFAAGC